MTFSPPEFRVLISPRSGGRVHMAPLESDPGGSLLGLRDARGQVNEPGLTIARSVQDGVFPNLLELDLLGRPGSGKTTTATQLRTTWANRTLLGARPIQVFEVDVAPIFSAMRAETGQPDTSQWESDVFEEVDRRASILLETARDRVKGIIRQGGNAIVLAEVCGTDVTRPSGVRVSRGGRSWRERVGSERGLPADERTTLAVAFVADSLKIPDRAGNTRALVAQSQGERSQSIARRLRDEGHVRLVGLKGRDVCGIVKGAQSGTIRLVEEEMGQLTQQLESTPQFGEHLRSIQTHDTSLPLASAREAAAWATVMQQEGTLGEMDGCSTVLINHYRPDLSFHVPE